jgi:toxin YoeB
MEIEYTLEAQNDIAYWKEKGSVAILKKITQLIESISETPFFGIGKPEALKYELSGCWSRRIDKKNRIVYEVVGNTVYIVSMKGHYER